MLLVRLMRFWSRRTSNEAVRLLIHLSYYMSDQGLQQARDTLLARQVNRDCAARLAAEAEEGE